MSNTITFPRSDGSKKTFGRSDGRLQSYLTQSDRTSADGDFRHLGPWRSGQQLWTDLAGSSYVLILRGRTISNIFGAKPHHANVLKGSFSTDCKSNCIRNGLRARIAGVKARFDASRRGKKELKCSRQKKNGKARTVVGRGGEEPAM